MAATEKFLFDHDFATGERPTITMAEHDRRRADAEAIAYRKGYGDAQAKALAEAEEKIAQALGAIGDTMARLSRGLDGVEARLEVEAVDVAVAIARKLAPALLAREPFAEIEALVRECFEQLASTPHIVVRVSDDIYASVKDKLETIARGRGFEGRLAILSEHGLAPGDCRIEWADGGINRDRNATETAIAEVVARYIAGRSADAE
jgi:flagellar assembly protein FliH